MVDLNTIPQFLIDSVDVVTGGASAVYGSDALVGVVNFRLRTDLDGWSPAASTASPRKAMAGATTPMSRWQPVRRRPRPCHGLCRNYIAADHAGRPRLLLLLFGDGAGTTGEMADWALPWPVWFQAARRGRAAGPLHRHRRSGATQAGAGTNYCSGTAAQCGTAVATAVLFDPGMKLAGRRRACAAG